MNIHGEQTVKKGGSYGHGESQVPRRFLLSLRWIPGARGSCLGDKIMNLCFNVCNFTFI